MSASCRRGPTCKVSQLTASMCRCVADRGSRWFGSMPLQAICMHSCCYAGSGFRASLCGPAIMAGWCLCAVPRSRHLCIPGICCLRTSDPFILTSVHPAGLQTLVIEDCSLQELPPCLTAASRLEELSLQWNADLVVSSADVDGILAHLPALRLLRLDERQLAPGAATRLQALAARQPLLQLEVRQEEEVQEAGTPPAPA